ncbi:MAG TPA: flavodoxin family protein, partial [bacterium]|nr:flavodoxin family protein [bacterium]
ETEKTRRGYSIAIGGTKGPSLFNGLNLLLKCFFSIVDIEYDEEKSLFYRSVDEKGAIMRHETAADDARRLGRLIAAGE